MKQPQLFDEWPETYDQWFTTPIGALVKKYESDLVLDLLKPDRGEKILDAGCGTGVLTLDILSAGADVIGLDLSLPMLKRAGEKLKGYCFEMVLGNLASLPFSEGCFDKTVSVTALEFVEDGAGAVRELSRVTRKGGSIVVATLNRLSPWASRRKKEAEKGHTLFGQAIFRSPDELRSLAPTEGLTKTAIHFQKGDDPRVAPQIEREGQRQHLNTGAFVAARWEKP
jgi:ubiquinone/menaquinone biosynthesis C-methylase UbiE